MSSSKSKNVQRHFKQLAICRVPFNGWLRRYIQNKDSTNDIENKSCKKQLIN